MNNFALPSNKGALEKKLDQLYDVKNSPNRNNVVDKKPTGDTYKGLLNQSSQGNLRYRHDSVNMTKNTIQKLKDNMDIKTSQQNLLIQGAQPPLITQNEPPVLKQNYRNSSILNQKDDNKTFSGLQKGRSYSTANLNATRVYTQAIADTKQFIQQNYMRPPPKLKNQALNPKNTEPKPTTTKKVNNDIEGVLSMEFPTPQSNHIIESDNSSSNTSQGQNQDVNFLDEYLSEKEQLTKKLGRPPKSSELQQIVDMVKKSKTENEFEYTITLQQNKQVDVLNAQNGYALTNSTLGNSNKLSFVYDQNIHKNGITIDSPPKFQNLTKFKDVEKKAMEIEKIRELEGKAIEANIHHLWTDFMNEQKKDPESAKLIVKVKEPVIIEKRAEKSTNKRFEGAINSSRKLFSKNFLEIQDESSSYDPESIKYIYRDLAPKVSNLKQFLYFGYNGNYPENQINAIENRGCWKVLQYKDQLVQCNKIMNKKFQAKSSAYPHEDMPDKVSTRVVDEHLIDKCHFIWRPCNFYETAQNERINKRMKKLSLSEQAPLIFNHFENMSCLGSKSGLIKSLRQYYYTQPEAMAAAYTEFDTTATTYLVLSQKQDNQMEEMQLRFKQIARGYVPKEKLPMKHCVHNLWLVKPANANQGRGIELFSNLEMMMQFINTRPAGTHCVVQKYIERPLLYHNRKFDIRVWAVVTNNNEIYFYREGYLRTSSNHYSLESSDLTTHLTNQCLQVKHKDSYGVHEEGNTLSYSDFQEYLDSPQFQAGYGQPVDICVYKDLVPRMKDIVIDSFLAVKTQINPSRRRNQFELFGYDFMIDEDFRVWLIEINTNPYLGKPNKWTQTFVPNMVDEMFQIVLDPIYPPKPEYYREHRVKLRKFELIYAEGTISNMDYLPKKDKSGIINERRKFDYDLMYPIKSLIQTNQNSVELKMLREQYRGNISNSLSSLDQKFRIGSFQYQKRENTRDSKRESYLSDLMKQSSLYKRKQYRPSSAAPQIRKNSVFSSQTPKPSSFKRLDLDKGNHQSASNKKNSDLQEIQEVFNDLYVDLESNKQERALGGVAKDLKKAFDPFSEEQRKQHQQVFQKVAQSSTAKKILDDGSVKENVQNEKIEDYNVSEKIKTLEEQKEEIKKKRKQIYHDTVRALGGPTGGTVSVGGPGLSSGGSVFNNKLATADYDRRDGPSDPEELFDRLASLNIGGDLEPKNSVIKEQPEEEPLDNPLAKKSLELSEEDDDLLEKGMNEERFHKLVRQQKFDLISGKLNEFWKSTDRQLQVKLFFEIFNSICQKYFLDEFGNLDPDFVLNDECKIKFQQMISQFGELLNEEVDLPTGPEILNQVQYKKKAPIIVKPKQIDTLIEILMNENLSKQDDLCQIIIEYLNKQTKSIYQKQKNDPDSLEQLRNSNSLPPLAESSQAVKDHLLKKAYLRKLLVIHQSLQGKWPVQYMMERVLINLTSIAETRAHLNSVHLQKLSIYWRRQEKNGMVKDGIIPEEVRRFRFYEDVYQKCLVQNGLIAYLISANCSQQTYSYLLQKVLTKYDIEGLQMAIDNHVVEIMIKIEDAYAKGNGKPMQEQKREKETGYEKFKEQQQQSKPDIPPSQFLKFVDKNVDFNNLKSRLRLVYKQKFDGKQRSESAKSVQKKPKSTSLNQIKEVAKEVEKVIGKQQAPEKSNLEILQGKGAKAQAPQPTNRKADVRPKSAAAPSGQRGRQMVPIKQIQQVQAQPSEKQAALPQLQNQKPSKPVKKKETKEVALKKLDKVQDQLVQKVEQKETKTGKDPKYPKPGKDQKDPKSGKDPKDTKPSKESKDPQPSKESKEPKPLKDAKETIDKQPDPVSKQQDPTTKDQADKNVKLQVKQAKKKKSHQTVKSNEVQNLEKFKSPLEAALKKLDKLQEQLIQKVELNKS